MKTTFQEEWRHYLWLSVGLGALVLMLVAVLPPFSSAPAQAQGELGLEISKTLVGSETVQVGQVLEFVIRVRNNGTVPITHLVVLDEFEATIVEPAGVGEFAQPDDPPFSDPLGTFDGNNTITWDNLLEDLPDQELKQNEELEIRVFLRAVRPTEQLQTVNRARIAEAIRSSGESEKELDEDEVNDEVGGAQLPLEKRLEEGVLVAVGERITFTLEVENDGLIDMETVPLRDEYDPSVLEFIEADPPPSGITVTDETALLEWDDLVAITGRDRLEPGESIVVTTAYTALQEIEGAVNSAEVVGARDEYENDIAPDQAEVPIRIEPGQATATPSSTPTASATPTMPFTTTARVAETIGPRIPTTRPDTNSGRDDDDEDDEDDEDDDNDEGAGSDQSESSVTPAVASTTGVTATATATATPFATATSTRTTTPTIVTGTTMTATRVTIGTPTGTPVIPASLPKTSTPQTSNTTWLLIGALVLLISGALLVWQQRRSGYTKSE